MKVRVVRKRITRLRRGDKIIAIRPACVEREAGINQRAKWLGEFVMRHQLPEDLVAVVHRTPDGKVVGHESSYLPDEVAFVLEEVAA